eukprot:TRINITY_DN308_c0_g1_i1.p1 TRINITY_DN308_c0_g1~~TRINITY_DN308_c0_g1_i1.p1  ORF type:complete len:527 (-),score=215.71 TRINITY_DN308_c0_g1_i1:82-1662(-)
MRVLLFVALGLLALCQAQQLIFPTQYEAYCTMILPYAEITEPIHIWFDAAAKSSRIDYYGGENSYYYLAAQNQTLSIYPTSVGVDSWQSTCFAHQGDVPLTSVFPDVTGFVLQPGTVTVNGIPCQDWRLIQTQNGRTNTYDLYVNPDTSLPVQYRMMGYDSLFGSHYDEYVLNYNAITPGPVASSIFVPPSMICSPNAEESQAHVASKDIHRLHPTAEDDVEPAFASFVNKHQRTYESDAERARRKVHYLNNMRFVNFHNRRKSNYKVALNHMADWSREEMRVRHLNKQQPPTSGNGANALHTLSLPSLPPRVDWREQGAVSAVKDQGICGSCWSFGAHQAIEGAYFMKTGKLIRLSSQALVDCSWESGNNGCGGGLDFQAYQWVMKAGGIPSESDYPYLMINGQCHVTNVSALYPITGYVNVTSGDTNALMDAVATRGPISISLDASQPDFTFYSSGVYDNPACSPTNLDHTVLLAGYDTDAKSGQTYWIVKNSWSTHWGNQGYISIATRNNVCGVATSPTYVLV